MLILGNPPVLGMQAECGRNSMQTLEKGVVVVLLNGRWPSNFASDIFLFFCSHQLTSYESTTQHLPDTGLYGAGKEDVSTRSSPILMLKEFQTQIGLVDMIVSWWLPRRRLDVVSKPYVSGKMEYGERDTRKKEKEKVASPDVPGVGQISMARPSRILSMRWSL
jgi:hypothetical protein